MKSNDMNKLISQLNGCLEMKGFTVGLNRTKTAEVLERWFDWYLHLSQPNKEVHGAD